MIRNIGILGAMAQEIDEVKALLTEKTVVKIANREFVVGKIGTVRCVVAFSKWGKVAATITATLMIQEFGVTDLFFIGTAGALADGLKVGDIVVAKRLEITMSPTFRPSAKAPAVPMKNKSVTPNSCTNNVAVMVAATLPHLEKATTQRTLPILPTTNSRLAIFTTVFSVNKAFTSSISWAIAPSMPIFLVII